jgi:hypothetical protein
MRSRSGHGWRRQNDPIDTSEGRCERGGLAHVAEHHLHAGILQRRSSPKLAGAILTVERLCDALADGEPKDLGAPKSNGSVWPHKRSWPPAGNSPAALRAAAYAVITMGLDTDIIAQPAVSLKCAASIQYRSPGAF